MLYTVLVKRYGCSMQVQCFCLQDDQRRSGSSHSLNRSGWQHHSQPPRVTQPEHNYHSAANQAGTLTGSVCSVEPFSDDDDVTVLDTTEIIKHTYPPNALNHHISERGPSDMTKHMYSPHALNQHMIPHEHGPTPNIPSPPSPSLQSLHSDGYSLVDSSHLDSASDLIFEITPNNSEYYTPSSSNGSHTSYRSLSPNSHKSVQQHNQQHQQQDDRIYMVYDSDPQLLATIPESDGRSQHLSTGSSHSRHVDGDYMSSGKSHHQVQPYEFRDMVDQLIASGEHQAAQNHAAHVTMSGGTDQVLSSGSMHPIWEDEEDCHIHNLPCRVTIGGLATI